MGTPSKEQLDQALATAISMRENGHDPHFVAKSLLNCHYRLEHLEAVFKLVQDYLRAGQDEQIHARLVKSIDHYRELEQHTAAEDHLRFGLD